MLKRVVAMRIVSILLSLSMVLSTIGNGTAGFDCATNTTDASGTTTYTYDGQNRLKTATYSDGTKDVYTFDDNGNRLTKTFTDSEGTVTVHSLQKVVGLAEQYGVKVSATLRDLAGHVGTPWPGPHVHLGDGRIYIGIAEEAVK